MKVSQEIHRPTRWYSKLLAAVLSIAFFFVLAASIVAAYLIYRIVAPVSTQSQIDTTNFPGHPEEVTYASPGGQNRTGWFFPGLKSAPIIVLCPGYQIVPGDFLPLAAAIQDHVITSSRLTWKVPQLAGIRRWATTRRRNLPPAWPRLPRERT